MSGWNDNPVQVLVGDCRALLPELPSESVQCCVTSPPYWGLRDYGNDGQLGLEKTPEEYVAKMVEVFREVRRVLRKDGTLWLNLGDSFAANGISGLAVKGESSTLVGTANSAHTAQRKTVPRGLKPKDMVGIPWRVAFALQADGWWLRSDIIWAKPNPMPESVTDRPTKSHEYLFLLTKSASYYYDSEAIKERSTENDWQSRLERSSIKSFPTDKVNGIRVRIHAGWKTGNGAHGSIHADGREQEVTYNEIDSSTRNKRSVWTVATAPYPEAHFATYPPDLIKPCIMAGTSAKGCCAKCGAQWERIVEREVVSVSDSPRYSGVSLRNDSEDGRTERSSKTLGWKPACKCEATVTSCIVLDPFAGSGTTGMVALELGRKAILIELSPKYAALVEQRTSTTMGLALA